MEKNILVILGNGFDLDLGWKTSYKDFYLAKRHRFAEWSKNKFVENMVKEDAWYDLEGYLRTSALSLSKEEVEDYLYFYKMCESLIKEYLDNRSSGVYSNTKKDSCAYQLLSRMKKDTNVITFNYTDPFSQESMKITPDNVIHIHGNLMGGHATEAPILGFDEKAAEINSLIADSAVRDLIKSHKHNYIETFIKLVKEADVILIYGHSLSITDADYFALFLRNFAEGNLSKKKLYIVTYDTNARISIKKNMKEYNVNYDDILCNSDATTIFTSEGPKSPDFMEMLKTCCL